MHKAMTQTLVQKLAVGTNSPRNWKKLGPASRKKIQSKVLALAGCGEVNEFVPLHIAESLIERKGRLGAGLTPPTGGTVP